MASLTIKDPLRLSADDLSLVLDAAEELIITNGIRMVSIQSLAEKCQIPAAAISRHFYGIEDIVSHCLSREIDAIIDEIPKRGADITSLRARVTTTFVETVMALIQAPVTAALREWEPELLVPLFLDRQPLDSSRFVSKFVEMMNDVEGREIDIRDLSEEFNQFANISVSVTQSFLLLSDNTRQEIGDEGIARQLYTLVDRYLVPLPGEKTFACDELPRS
ncbi:MAG: TetR/AcrR family transcriptional regulator [Actinomycetaceae bacterium]|nr:TetR/AcrR family transcriptional regulator [Actinomycetaceae bacterium]